MIDIKTKTRSMWKHLGVAGVAAAASLLAVTPAQAQDKIVGQFGWLGVGKAYEIDKGHYYWVGEFSGTFFNDKGDGSPLHLAGVKCPAFNDLDFANKRLNAGGYCIVSDLDGDQLYLSWRIPAGTPGPGGKSPGTFEYTGGTGKYQNWRGKNTFVGVTQINWADGTASGYATWNR